MNPEDKITKARSLLILDHPFFGCLALRLKIEQDKSCPTAIVDGKVLKYNPDFIEGLTVNETVGVMAHEVMHVALGHHWRQGKRDFGAWNKATDYALNPNILQAQITLPKEALVNPEYDDLSAEEIYTKITQSPKQDQRDSKKDKSKGKSSGKDKRDQKSPNKQNPQMSDPGGCGAVKPTTDEKEMKEQQAEWKEALVQATMAAKGDIPGGLARKIKELIDPSIPWYVLLRDFVERTARNDYDWSRPNRRYINMGLILPSLISEELPEVIIAIDTSGSIDKEALSTFAEEASSVLGTYDTQIRVIYCDSKIHGEELYQRADLPMKINPKGGGGTNFKPVFEYIKDKGYAPACLIYFTDMFGRFPEEEPDYPTMWITKTKDRKAPFGATVIFK